MSVTKHKETVIYSEKGGITYASLERYKGVVGAGTDEKSARTDLIAQLKVALKKKHKVR
jgi:hypothetical protein